MLFERQLAEARKASAHKPEKKHYKGKADAVALTFQHSRSPVLRSMNPNAAENPLSFRLSPTLNGGISFFYSSGEYRTIVNLHSFATVPADYESK